MRAFGRCLVLSLCVALAAPTSAQWTNRYPKVAGYGHHVYLEGYELPLLTNGPIDAVASPTAGTIAFASRGWLWMFDPTTGVARRITAGAGIDARPAFSPDGSSLVFVRDRDDDTTVVLLDIRSGQERVLVDTGSIDIDPVFTPDGAAVFYTSAEAGDLDLWVVGVDGSEPERLTAEPGLELAARPTADGYVYLAKTRGGVDELRWHHAGADELLLQARIASQSRPALNPAGTLVAINVPVDTTQQLLVVDLANPGTQMRLARAARLPLTPSWTANGAAVLYSEADTRQRMRLYEAPLSGAPATEIRIREWDWGVPTATVRVRTRVLGRLGFSPSRLSAWDRTGHPLVAETGMTYLDGRSGWPFFYSDGDVEFTVPAGQIRVAATRGLTTVPMETALDVPASGSGMVEFELRSVWPGEGDWASGDHHFHLNYGGAYDLSPGFLALVARGENLDVPTPLTANLHNRYEDLRFWDWEGPAWPLIRFGQEIRSHFLGHVGILGASRMIWPWIWGPGYEVYRDDDRPNADVLAAGRAQGGIGYYVHPVSSPDPFAAANLGGFPVEIIADAVLGDLDALEVVCLWSDEIGTAALWHRFLNLGMVIAPSAGTDVMSNLVRTMAIGSTRVYVHQPEGLSWDGYLAGLREGRSFVTNGPMLELAVIDDVRRALPGDTVRAGTVEFEVSVATATEVERIEILVNGEVVVSEPGLPEAGSRRVQGTLDLPDGGWVAARAAGGSTRWPAMDSYPWAHTAPIWIGTKGSSESGARQAAATDLLRALEVATERLNRGYAGVDIPRLRQRFAAARTRLIELGAVVDR